MEWIAIMGEEIAQYIVLGVVILIVCFWQGGQADQFHVVEFTPDGAEQYCGDS